MSDWPENRQKKIFKNWYRKVGAKAHCNRTGHCGRPEYCRINSFKLRNYGKSSSPFERINWKNSGTVFSVWDGRMARKTEGKYELQIIIQEKEIQRLERGKVLEIGLISLGPCIKVTLKKGVKSPWKLDIQHHNRVDDEFVGSHRWSPHFLELVRPHCQMNQRSQSFGTDKFVSTCSAFFNSQQFQESDCQVVGSASRQIQGVRSGANIALGILPIIQSWSSGKNVSQRNRKTLPHPHFCATMTAFNAELISLLFKTPLMIFVKAWTQDQANGLSVLLEEEARLDKMSDALTLGHVFRLIVNASERPVVCRHVWTSVRVTSAEILWFITLKKPLISWTQY